MTRTTRLREIPTRETIKNAVAGVKQSLRIKIPGPPAAPGPVGDTATSAASGVTESATGTPDRVVAAGETAASGAVDTASGLPTAVATSTQALPNPTGTLGDPR